MPRISQPAASSQSYSGVGLTVGAVLGRRLGLEVGATLGDAVGIVEGDDEG